MSWAASLLLQNKINAVKRSERSQRVCFQIHSQYRMQMVKWNDWDWYGRCKQNSRKISSYIWAFDFARKECIWMWMVLEKEIAVRKRQQQHKPTWCRRLFFFRRSFVRQWISFWFHSQCVQCACVCVFICCCRIILAVLRVHWEQQKHTYSTCPMIMHFIHSAIAFCVHFIYILHIQLHNL